MVEDEAEKAGPIGNGRFVPLGIKKHNLQLFTTQPTIWRFSIGNTFGQVRLGRKKLEMAGQISTEAIMKEIKPHIRGATA